MKFEAFMVWAAIQPRQFLIVLFVGGLLLGLTLGVFFGWLAFLFVIAALIFYRSLILNGKPKG